MDGFHRPPGLPVGRGQAEPLRGAVQHVGVDDLGAQVLERAGERLLDLDARWARRDRRAGGDPAPPEGELGLQEQVVPRHQAARDRRRDGLADRGLVVVAALVGGVDAAEALLAGPARSGAASRPPSRRSRTGSGAPGRRRSIKVRSEFDIVQLWYPRNGRAKTAEINPAARHNAERFDRLANQSHFRRNRVHLGAESSPNGHKSGRKSDENGPISLSELIVNSLRIRSWGSGQG